MAEVNAGVGSEAAATGPFKGLIASGWHATSMMMRLYARPLRQQGRRCLESLRVDELRWIQPVRPGDSLSIRTDDPRGPPIAFEAGSRPGPHRHRSPQPARRRRAHTHRDESAA
ncbi:MaoC/PaaZ C-terminal domain-containing protein [Streptomyces sp. KR55]|uniref:MaoC/PaaZ C-terminal domain-containing protein n=1 Tax=Streptomyces sp. KR55 TaxID=3457425 RepID=UPI003FD27D32